MHDAWALYDTYAEADHQLCCAHAQRELAAVAHAAPTDAAPTDAAWCWATQAGDALVAMQKLVGEAIAAGADAVDPDALANQVQVYRSAAQIGLTQTATRSDKVMRKHNALARRTCSTGKTTTGASPPTGEYQPTTTAPSPTSA